MSSEGGIRYIDIFTIEDIDHLVRSINNGSKFADLFKIHLDELIIHLFSALEISEKIFNHKNYFYDKNRNLHISYTHEGYFWISTMGLISQKSFSQYNNQFVKAFRSQFRVTSILLDEALRLCENENVYNMNGYTYWYLIDLAPAIFNNLVFYFEILSKAYLSLSNVDFNKTHRLSNILPIVKETMFKKCHNDTVFHKSIISSFENTVNYIKTIPGNFKEQNIKYEDNSCDNTSITFDRIEIQEIINVIWMSNDFIMEYYYYKDKDTCNTIYLKQGLFESLVAKATSDEERQRIIREYEYLVRKP